MKDEDKKNLTPPAFPSSVARPPQYTATEDGQATAEDGRPFDRLSMSGGGTIRMKRFFNFRSP
jgi:hypothetical protein